MAGHMGVDQKTVKNLEVIDLTDGILLVKGLVPGHISSIVTITKRGVNKKAMGLYKEVVEEEILENAKVEEIGPSVEEQEEMRKETEAKAEEAEKAEAAEAQVANQVDKPEVEVTATEEVVSEPVEAVAEETPEIIAEETKEEEEAK
jgi:hypothetical protein